MIDILSIEDGKDIRLADSIVPRAANVLATQLGSLEYAKSFGVDLKFFFQTPFQIQSESFKAYLVQRLTEHQINVSSVIDVFEFFFRRYTFFVSDPGEGRIGSGSGSTGSVSLETEDGNILITEDGTILIGE